MLRNPTNQPTIPGQSESISNGNEDLLRIP